MKRQTRDFSEVIRAELAADEALAHEVAEARFHAEVARQVYALRQKAGLTQKELAERINTHQSVISRIEDADYEGHSLSILLRIGFALNKQLQLRFTDPPEAKTRRLARSWHTRD
jgi:ribosome-binding protein aMBF1 (putative translation factor)